MTTGDYSFVDHSIDFGFHLLCSPPLICSPVPTPVTSVNGTTGIIILNVYNGTSNYTYDWNNGTTLGFGAGPSITGLSPGDYRITVTDEDGCTTTTFSTVEDVICVPQKTVIEKTKIR